MSFQGATIKSITRAEPQATFVILVCFRWSLLSMELGLGTFNKTHFGVPTKISHRHKTCKRK
eukprot:2529936-Amphidinium_carterae.1